MKQSQQHKIFNYGGGDDVEDNEEESRADNNQRIDSPTIKFETCVVDGKEVLVETGIIRECANLPRSIVYQLHLMHILNSCSHVNLSLFSKINNCVTYHAKEHNVDFKSDKMYSHDDLVQFSTEVYGLHGMKPKMNFVALLDRSKAVVPTFDVKTMLLLILNESTKMKPENIAPKYNLFTGRPTKEVTEIGKVHTGWTWEEARSHHCGDNPNVLPLGLIGFYD